MDFAQQEEMIMSILSVSGEVSSVTLQSAMGGDLVTYEVYISFSLNTLTFYLPLCWGMYIFLFSF